MRCMLVCRRQKVNMHNELWVGLLSHCSIKKTTSRTAVAWFRGHGCSDGCVVTIVTWRRWCGQYIGKSSLIHELIPWHGKVGSLQHCCTYTPQNVSSLTLRFKIKHIVHLHQRIRGRPTAINYIPYVVSEYSHNELRLTPLTNYCLLLHLTSWKQG